MEALVESASKLVEDPEQDADYTDPKYLAKSQMLSTMKSERIAKHLQEKAKAKSWGCSIKAAGEDYLQAVADYVVKRLTKAIKFFNG